MDAQAGSRESEGMEICARRQADTERTSRGGVQPEGTFRLVQASLLACRKSIPLMVTCGLCFGRVCGKKGHFARQCPRKSSGVGKGTKNKN